MRDIFKLLFARQGDILGPGWVPDGVDVLSVYAYLLGCILGFQLFITLLPGVPPFFYAVAVCLTFVVGLLLDDFSHYHKEGV